ncbi:MAG: DMT family transporter [Alphaproteobacteria bacterium]|nr:DMT family transporter [Alphaproteobacteria bacterium]
MLIVVFLGVNFVAVRFSNAELPPFWGAALRFAVASALLFGVVAAMRLPLPRGKALTGAVLFGLLAFGATYALLYWALVAVPAGLASVLFATVPLVTLLLASTVGLERLTWTRLAGTLVVIAGVAVVFRDQLGADVPLTALLATMLAAVAAALSGIVVKGFPRSHPITVNASAMATGAGLLLAGSWLAGEAPALPTLSPTWIALAWLITSSVAAFVLMVWVLSRWTASATSYAVVLSPLVTVGIGAVLAGERVTLAFAVGSALVLLGVVAGALIGPRSP